MTTAPTLALPITNTLTVPVATSTPTMSGASMPSMHIASSGHCQTSMFWNWYTINACFLSPTWHITSQATFAGSCIGVMSLVILLEGLRRLQRGYERLLIRQDRKAGLGFGKSSSEGGDEGGLNECGTGGRDDLPHSAVPLLGGLEPLRGRGSVPTVWQQGVRAGLYVLQFAVAYMVMLLGMYYNGYIIFCIFVGAFVGFFIFAWDVAPAASVGSSENAACCA